jgi:hypothetical protein
MWWVDTLSDHDAHLVWDVLKRRWDREDALQALEEWQRRWADLEAGMVAFGEACGMMLQGLGKAAESFVQAFGKGMERDYAVGDDSLRESGPGAVQDGAPLVEDGEDLPVAGLPVLRPGAVAEPIFTLVRRSWLQLRRPSWLRRTAK